MFNKKRLAMMAVAASMVLPTNLTYLSVATSVTVFAEEASKPIASASDLGNITNSGYRDLDGSYQLTADITVDNYIYVEEDKTVAIDLNGHKLTSEAGWPIIIKKNGSLTITDSSSNKSGEIIAAACSESLIALNAEGASLDISDVKITDSAQTVKAAIAVSAPANNATLTAKNITIDANVGVSINGLSTGATVTLEDVKITAKEGGVYQAGPSEVTIKGAATEINGGTFGVETRAGTLTVEAGTIEGGTGNVISVSNENGSTTGNVGIAVAQHSTKESIEVKISGEDTVIKGGAALFIGNPQGNEDTDLEKIEVEVTDAKLEGSTYDVVYSEDVIPFTLENVKMTTNKIQKVTLEEDGEATPVDPENIDPDKIPYTIINESISADALEAIANEAEEGETPTVDIELEDEALKDLFSGLDLETLKGDEGLTKDTLQDALKAKSEKTVTTDEGKEVAPGYTFEIEGLAGFELKSKGDGLSLVAEDGAEITISVKLQNESNIKLTTEDEDTTGEETDPEEPEAPTTEEEIAIQSEAEEADGDEEEPSSENITTYATVEALKGDSGVADKAAIDAYLQNNDSLKDLEVVENSLPDEGLKADTPIKISGEDSEVDLDDNGFIVVKLQSKEAQEEPTTPPANNNRPSGNKKPKPEQPAEEPVVGTPTTMYRLYNKLTGEHLYTIDKNERDNLLTSDTWKDEGEGWIAPSESPYPVYRLLNPNNGDHHYTTDKNEFDTLPSYGWVAEGVAFFSADKDNAENVLLHRVYNPNAEGAGSHHYTADTNERDALVAQGWKYEGLAWAGLPANK